MCQSLTAKALAVLFSGGGAMSRLLDMRAKHPALQTDMLHHRRHAVSSRRYCRFAKGPVGDEAPCPKQNEHLKEQEDGHVTPPYHLSLHLCTVVGRRSLTVGGTPCGETRISISHAYLALGGRRASQPASDSPPRRPRGRCERGRSSPAQSFRWRRHSAR
ncbi:uncharacterized protein BDZ99DRAFT_130802 [Mytilinidion resinicola]|uniref:Uncharacterized protein n=1 Tax=Mytilinidion resinicola TaxID=574789 RepID=A0A6A6Z7I7_9PEZI|nr:uncharacterized protein BDZ99DRAFT_130802 [Mytilinidion resinicola]KAF2816197.1 hypothetical protein BDZ99DRAFT_130802 [Mytilinidion resinicola]